VGEEANEESFKRLAPGRRYLHLATHGFYLDAKCVQSQPGVKVRGLGAATASSPAARRDDENPLLLSGIALSGANRRASGRDEDGILTAEEVVSMDLSGVDWAVLSACKTGVGAIHTGEGLFGLRRAFQIAGARTLISSLWPVEDNATRRWMAALYRARFESGLGTTEAVRQASLSVLIEGRRDGKTAHPFFWAAFVAAGDWR
jgi:CHAT domain-containing protein